MKYGRLCSKIALNIVKNESDAEECVNDAYLKIWDNVPPTVPNPLITYVCQIVRTVSINRYNSNVSQKRNNVSDVALHELEDVLYSKRDIDDELEAKRIGKAISEFLDTLDPDGRVMFVKRYCFGESVSDIAKYFHKSAHSVTARLARNREKLRKYLIEKEIMI